jgi:WD40 repeat protein
MISAKTTLPLTVCLALLIAAAARGQLNDPEQRRLEDPDAVTALAYSPDGKALASVGPDGILKLWNTATGKKCWAVRAHRGDGFAVAYSPDGTLLASVGRDGAVRLADAATGEERGLLKGHARPVTALVFTADGKGLFSGSRDGTIRLWDVAERRESQKVDAHNYGVLSLCLSGDGRVLVSAGNALSVVENIHSIHSDQPHVWDAATLHLLRKCTVEGSMASLSRDGRTLAVLGDQTTFQVLPNGGIREDRHLSFCVVDAATGKPRSAPPLGGCGWVTISPDGRTLAGVGSGDAVLWDIATNKKVDAFPGEVGCPPVFSPDGKWLALGTRRGGIRLRQLPAEAEPSKDERKRDER